MGFRILAVKRITGVRVQRDRAKLCELRLFSQLMHFEKVMHHMENKARVTSVFVYMCAHFANSSSPSSVRFMDDQSGAVRGTASG